MDTGRRPRGRPPGVSVKPYKPRVPKREGYKDPSARQEEFSPQERFQMRTYLEQYELTRQDLLLRANLGDATAQVELTARFQITFPPLDMGSRQPFCLGCRSFLIEGTIGLGENGSGGNGNGNGSTGGIL